MVEARGKERGGRGGGGVREKERATKPTYNQVLLLHICRKSAHFPVRDLNALSAYPVIVNSTHYERDEGWFSDTELPPEILAQIRERKKREEAEEQKKLMEKAHQNKVKDEAMKRQIESVRENTTQLWNFRLS